MDVAPKPVFPQKMIVQIAVPNDTLHLARQGEVRCSQSLLAAAHERWVCEASALLFA
jgi:hypothetical protein